MGVLIAAVIIIALIFYALKDLLADKDFSAWTNIALTSLILFTVILSIFMILHKPYSSSTRGAATPEQAQQETTAQNTQPLQPQNNNVEDMSNEQVMSAIAEEYVKIEDEYKKEVPNAKDSAQVASNYIMSKYNFTAEDWNDFLQYSARHDLIAKARAKQNGVDYVIPTSK